MLPNVRKLLRHDRDRFRKLIYHNGSRQFGESKKFMPHKPQPFIYQDSLENPEILSTSLEIQ